MSPPPPGGEDWDEYYEDDYPGDDYGYGDDDRLSDDELSQSDSASDVPYLSWPDTFDAGTEVSSAPRSSVSSASSSAQRRHEASERKNEAAAEASGGDRRRFEWNIPSLPAPLLAALYARFEDTGSARSARGDFRSLPPSGWASIHLRFTESIKARADAGHSHHEPKSAIDRLRSETVDPLEAAADSEDNLLPAEEVSKVRHSSEATAQAQLCALQLLKTAALKAIFALQAMEAAAEEEADQEAEHSVAFEDADSAGEMMSICSPMPPPGSPAAAAPVPERRLRQASCASGSASSSSGMPSHLEQIPSSGGRPARRFIRRQSHGAGNRPRAPPPRRVVLRQQKQLGSKATASFAAAARLGGGPGISAFAVAEEETSVLSMSAELSAATPDNSCYEVSEEEFERLMRAGALGHSDGLTDDSSSQCFEISEEDFDRLLQGGQLHPTEVFEVSDDFEASDSSPLSPPSTAPAAALRPCFEPFSHSTSSSSRQRPQSVDCGREGKWKAFRAGEISASLFFLPTEESGSSGVPWTLEGMGALANGVATAAGSPLQSARFLRGLKGLPTTGLVPFPPGSEMEEEDALRALPSSSGRLSSSSSPTLGSAEDGHGSSFIRRRLVGGPRASPGRLPQLKGGLGQQTKKSSASASKSSRTDSGAFESLDEEDTYILAAKSGPSGTAKKLSPLPC